MVQYISESPISPFDDCAFHIGVPARMETNAFALPHIMRRPVQKLFPPIHLHPDRLPACRLQVFYIFKNQLNAHVTDGLVFYFRDTIVKYFENTSITVKKYFIPSLYLLSPCTSVKSHSQNSMILFTP